METPVKIDTVHCLSGGLINLMLFLDGNRHMTRDKIILESPVFPSADMLMNYIGKYNKMYRQNAIII